MECKRKGRMGHTYGYYLLHGPLKDLGGTQACVTNLLLFGSKGPHLRRVRTTFIEDVLAEVFRGFTQP